jgi:hypothetical protein
MIKCKDCKYYFKYRENGLNSHFFDGNGRNGLGIELWVENDYLIQCQHSSCFEKITRHSPEYGATTTEKRIKGFYQLNKNNDCVLFEKKSYIRRLFGL